MTFEDEEDRNAWDQADASFRDDAKVKNYLGQRAPKKKITNVIKNNAKKVTNTIKQVSNAAEKKIENRKDAAIQKARERRNRDAARVSDDAASRQALIDAKKSKLALDKDEYEVDKERAELEKLRKANKKPGFNLQGVKTGVTKVLGNMPSPDELLYGPPRRTVKRVAKVKRPRGNYSIDDDLDNMNAEADDGLDDIDIDEFDDSTDDGLDDGEEYEEAPRRSYGPFDGIDTVMPSFSMDGWLNTSMPGSKRNGMSVSNQDVLPGFDLNSFLGTSIGPKGLTQPRSRESFASSSGAPSHPMAPRSPFPSAPRVSPQYANMSPAEREAMKKAKKRARRKERRLRHKVLGQ